MKNSCLLLLFFVIFSLLISCDKEEKPSTEAVIKSLTITVKGTEYSFENVSDTIQIYIPAGETVNSITINNIVISENATSNVHDNGSLPISSGETTIMVISQDKKTKKNYIVKISNYPYNSTIISSVSFAINGKLITGVITGDTIKATVAFDGTLGDIKIYSIHLSDNATSNPTNNSLVPLTNYTGTITVTAQDSVTSKTYFVKVILDFSSSYISCNLNQLGIIKSINAGFVSKFTLKYSPQQTMKFYRADQTYGICKAEFEEMSIYEGSTAIATNINWTNDVTGELTSKDVLKNNTAYKVVIKVNFLEKEGETWIPLKDINGISLSEQQEGQFTTENYTGNLIPDIYLSYTYPINRQFNFYTGEYSKGYYMFRYDLSKISQVKSVPDLKVRLIQYPQKDTIALLNTVYNTTDYTLEYDFPVLQKESIYKTELISDNNIIHEIYFRVSKYNSITEKLPSFLAGFGYTHELPGSVTGNGFYIYSEIATEENDEYFALYEFFGKDNISLVRSTPILSDCPWYQESLYKYIYDHYPVIPEAALSRDISITGIPPVKPILHWQSGDDRILTDAEINSGDVSYTVDYSILLNTLTWYWKSDYIKTYNALHSKYSSVDQISDLTIKQIYNTHETTIPAIKIGNYPILIEYVLPGKNIVTSSKTITVTCIVNEY